MSSRKDFDGYRHAATLATGRAGGTPLANLSRKAREGLKRPYVAPEPVEKQHHSESKAAARRLKQMQRQAAKAAAKANTNAS